jgi:hypothetical protein
MTDPSGPDPIEGNSREKITPFIENAILELALLTIKQFTTPFAVLFYTKDFRDQIKAFHNDEVNIRYSLTVARPLSFYVIWMAVHFLLAVPYWNYVLRTNAQLGDVAGQVPTQLKKAVDFMKNIGLSDFTGQVEALIIIAFAVTLIIGVKSALVTLVGRTIGCRIRLETVLYASAYTLGTLLFFQYVFILSHYSLEAIFGKLLQTAGYFVLIYGSLLLCIVLAVRINRMIRTVDGTREIPTFVSWFFGTLIWLYLIILVSGAVMASRGASSLSIAKFGKLIINVFVPDSFDVTL